jgi:hypothetical protein
MHKKSNITTDHQKIKEWVKDRGGFPAKVKGTGSPGVMRIDYEGYSGDETLERISWDDFFQAFDEEGLAFLYSTKKDSRFSKFVDRDDYDTTEGQVETPEYPGKPTPAKKPPMETSKAAKANHLEMAKRQGQTMQDAFNEMANNVAQRGEEKPFGEYLIGYAVEKPEGLYHLEGGKLVWKKPKNKNIHIEISVRDAASGRLIPGLRVMVTVLDEKGNEVGSHRHKLLWHPWLYHYGRNWRLPGDGKYTIRVHIPAPDFPRHDQKNGQRFEKSVWAEFKGVKCNTKQPQ